MEGESPSFFAQKFLGKIFTAPGLRTQEMLPWFKIDVGGGVYNGGMKKERYKGTENKAYIIAMREIRKSNAATTHDNRPNRLRTRKAVKTQAIKESL